MQVHPSQISPAEPFDIFYFVRNWTDSTTYYVQAKVYDVRTGEVLLTTKLTQSATNSRLFIKTEQAPPDPVGYGRNIVAIATVYTDAGYTQKSEGYEEQEQYYLVKAAQPQGGGGYIDYRVIRELVGDELAKIVKDLPKPERIEPPEAVSLDGLYGAIGKLQETVNRIPKDGVDLSGLRDRLDTLQGSLDVRPVFEATDLQPVLDAAERLENVLEAGLEQIERTTAEGQEAFLSLQERSMDTFADRLAESSQKAIREAAKDVNLTFTLPMSGTSKASRREAEAEPFDIRSLTS